MKKRTHLVPANDNRVPSSLQTGEQEREALDPVIGAAMDGEFFTIRRCKCAVNDSVPGSGRDD